MSKDECSIVLKNEIVLDQAPFTTAGVVAKGDKSLAVADGNTSIAFGGVARGDRTGIASLWWWQSATPAFIIAFGGVARDNRTGITSLWQWQTATPAYIIAVGSVARGDRTGIVSCWC